MLHYAAITIVMVFKQRIPSCWITVPLKPISIYHAHPEGKHIRNKTTTDRNCIYCVFDDSISSGITTFEEKPFAIISDPSKIYILNAKRNTTGSLTSISRSTLDIFSQIFHHMKV